MDGTNETDAEILWGDVVAALEESDLPAATIAMLESCTASELGEDVLPFSPEVDRSNEAPELRGL